MKADIKSSLFKTVYTEQTSQIAGKIAKEKYPFHLLYLTSTLKLLCRIHDSPECKLKSLKYHFRKCYYIYSQIRISSFRIPPLQSSPAEGQNTWLNFARTVPFQHEHQRQSKTQTNSVASIIHGK